MIGTLSGTRYRVVGRVVLGEEEQGETYYWNEFNLEDDAGKTATLVYEQTEQGGEWRLFHTFEPEFPMTAADAATKRAGDPLNIEGTQVFVRLVSTSRVYAIEGKAPEGVEVGDVAHYFNAVAGNTMIVVSWTGEEVEFYRGMDLPRTMVSAAFSVRIVDLSRFFPPQRGSGNSSGLQVALVVALIVVMLVVFGSGSFRSGHRAPAVVRTVAPVSRLVLGANGDLGGRRFQIRSYLLVEVAMVGRRFDRHEYLLSNDEGTQALLVCGSKPGASDWWLFTPFQPQTPLSAQAAAAIRWGQTLDMDGTAAKVSELFQSTIRRVESAEASDFNSGDLFFGFIGATPSAQLLVRWNNNYINFFKGNALLDKEVLRAFGQQSRP
jgi:Domain of unknown function (DUF4178)